MHVLNLWESHTEHESAKDLLGDLSQGTASLTTSAPSFVKQNENQLRKEPKGLYKEWML